MLYLTFYPAGYSSINAASNCIKGWIYSLKCAGVEIHSFRSHIRDHFVLEWKSTLKILESQKFDSNHYLGVDSTIICDWIQLQMK